MSSRGGKVSTDVSDESPVRTLRHRTARQERPFQAEKLEHAFAKRGLKPSESDLEDNLQNAKKTKTKKASSKVRRQKEPSSNLSADTQWNVADTVLRTWFSEKPDANIPVKLTMSTIDELFNKLEESWRWALGDRTLSCCIASFSWLADDTNMFLVRSSDATSFDELLRAARHSLTTGNDADKINISISI